MVLHNFIITGKSTTMSYGKKIAISTNKDTAMGKVCGIDLTGALF